MGLDDDRDCVEHVWRLDQIGMRDRLLDFSSTCARCGAVQYEPASDPGWAPPL